MEVRYFDALPKIESIECLQPFRSGHRNVAPPLNTASISASCSSLYLGGRIQLGASQNSPNTSFVVFFDEDCGDDGDDSSLLANSGNDFLISAGAAG